MNTAARGDGRWLLLRRCGWRTLSGDHLRISKSGSEYLEVEIRGQRDCIQIIHTVQGSIEPGSGSAWHP